MRESSMCALRISSAEKLLTPTYLIFPSSARRAISPICVFMEDSE